MALSETPPFFLVGNDRSGTTMLRLILDRSAAAVPAESMFLHDFAHVRRRGGPQSSEAAERLLRRVWEHPRVRAWGLPPEPPPVPPGLAPEEAYRFVVSAPFETYAEQHGKERWGDKTPSYLHHLNELDAVWPEARFLVLVRDGRDVALSLAGVPFGPNNAWAAARWWAAGARAGLEAQRRFGDRVLTLRYEDLATDPETHVRRACDFLALPYHPDLLAIEGRADGLARARDGIDASSVERWRREMSAEHRRLFASVAGRELAAAGYETEKPGPLGSARTAAYAGHDAALRAVNFVRLRLLRERGRELRYVLRRKLAWR